MKIAVSLTLAGLLFSHLAMAQNAPVNDVALSQIATPVAANAPQWTAVPHAPLPPQAHVLLPAARDFNAPGGLPVRKLFDFGTRDPNILAAPDGYFYLVATQGKDTLPASFPIRADADPWLYNDGIPLWRSHDLKNWETMGVVWSLDKDATWAKQYQKSPWVSPKGELRRAVWAPEIHYFKGTYWICYSMNYGGTGILKSVSGLPTGPYRDVKTDGPITSSIDPTLFADDDGKVYLLWSGYSIARLKDDLSGLAEEPRELEVANRGWGEGIFLVKRNGQYVLINSGDPHTDDKTVPSTYDSFSAVSNGSIYGPYDARRRAIPYDGHNNLFQDKNGGWWSTYFGSGQGGPWQIAPGVLPVSWDESGHFHAARSGPRPLWKVATTQPTGDWTSANYDDKTWSEQAGAWGDPNIAKFGQLTDVGTHWISGELWLRRRFHVGATLISPQLFGRNSGSFEVFLNGKSVVQSDIATTDYFTRPLPASGLVKGDNIIAVRVQKGDGTAYFDIGVADTRERTLLPTTLEAPHVWRSTTQEPPQNWRKLDFDDANWASSPRGGFGHLDAEMNPATVTTPWQSSDIWLRTGFDWRGEAVEGLVLQVTHDDEAQVWLNGQQIADLSGNSANGEYKKIAVNVALLRRGSNVLAIHCHQNTGAQFVDAGLKIILP